MDHDDFSLERIALGELTRCDLIAEVEALSPDDRASAEAYKITFYGPGGYELTERGELLFVANAGRAGVCENADSVWTDAESAYDAVCRYQSGDVVP